MKAIAWEEFWLRFEEKHQAPHTHINWEKVCVVGLLFLGVGGVSCALGFEAGSWSTNRIIVIATTSPIGLVLVILGIKNHDSDPFHTNVTRALKHLQERAPDADIEAIQQEFLLGDDFSDWAVHRNKCINPNDAKIHFRGDCHNIPEDRIWNWVLLLLFNKESAVFVPEGFVNTHSIPFGNYQEINRPNKPPINFPRINIHGGCGWEELDLYVDQHEAVRKACEQHKLALPLKDHNPQAYLEAITEAWKPVFEIARKRDHALVRTVKALRQRYPDATLIVNAGSAHLNPNVLAQFEDEPYVCIIYRKWTVGKNEYTIEALESSYEYYRPKS